MLPASGCHGNGIEHCCWVDGAVCPFLELDTMAGRHWVCGLRRELGDWDLVHADPRYQPIHAVWMRTGTQDCGDFQGIVRDGTLIGQCCFEGLRVETD